MADDPTHRGGQDRDQIHLNQPHEVAYWTKALGASEGGLRKAVAEALMDDAISYIVVMNDSDGPYRQIVVHGPVEYRMLRDCFGALGFAFTFKEGQVAIARPTARSVLADGNLPS